MKRGQKRKKIRSTSKNLFITKGQRGNTICGMFSFGQLCGWILRFGVTHTDIVTVSSQLPHPKRPHPHPENITSSPHSSACDFVLFLRSCFTNSFVKPHKRLLSLVKPSLGKQWQGNSTFYAQRSITETAIGWVLRLLYRGQLEQTSSTMRYRRFSFRIKVGLYWKQWNVVHLVCAGVIMHAHYEFLVIAAGCMRVAWAVPSTKTT